MQGYFHQLGHSKNGHIFFPISARRHQNLTNLLS